MLNLFSFFKQQAAHWRQDCTGRSSDYLAGGLAALREASDTLTAHKDVVDMELLSQQLNEAHREARELRAHNKSLDEVRRTFQSKHDLLLKEVQALRSQLGNKRAKAPTDLGGEVGSLRQRIKELEEGGAVSSASLENQVRALRTELDKVKGTSRVGAHVTSLPAVLKSLRRVLRSERPADEKLAYVSRTVQASQDVLEGREPADWLDKPTYAA
jgi:predicted nuclease with TOPRIM domain